MAENFELACEEVKSFADKLSNDVKLSLYGNFKQATVGDNNTDKPGFLDLKGKSKWEAWNKLKGTSQLQAKINYVSIVKANAPADVAKNL